MRFNNSRERTLMNRADIMERYTGAFDVTDTDGLIACFVALALREIMC